LVFGFDQAHSRQRALKLSLVRPQHVHIVADYNRDARALGQGSQFVIEFSAVATGYLPTG
jgi:hypothetical protein